MKNKEWRSKSVLTEDSTEAAELSRALGVTPLTALLLLNRGCNDPEGASRFLDAAGGELYDPFMMNDMDKAAKRVLAAASRREKIMIYGDYDVDGVTSVSILHKYLSGIGCDVSYYIPSRETEGYGVNKEAIGSFGKSGVTLIITVDTGITAGEEAEYAGSLGIDMVITDHHECREELPEAVAVVNPKRPDSSYPFAGLAGVGVAFKLICACEIERRPGEDRELIVSGLSSRFLDLVAIGTIADVMPLIDENRILVRRGLELIKNSISPALAGLLEESGSKAYDRESGKCSITSSTVSFTLAPRINAAGRMERADVAVELFLSDDPAKISYYARKLCEANASRQEEENKIVASVVQRMGKPDKDQKTIILSDDSWSSGIIGIVASRITDRFGTLSILVSFDGDTGKGSGRSVEGINLVEALSECSDLLIKYGGHSLAAGLSIERSRFEEFCKRMNDVVERMSGGELPAPVIEYETEIKPNDITLDQIRELDRLEPFGISNPAPLFRMNDVRVADIIELKGGKHTKLTVEKNGLRFTALMFGTPRAALDLISGDKIDMLFSISENEFRGNVSIQLIVKTIKHCKAFDLDAEKQRYKEISEGAAYTRDEQVLPSRDELGAIYRYIREKCRSFGETYLNVREIQTAVPDGIGYVKARISLDILSGAKLIRFENGEGTEDTFRTGVNFVSGKIDLEKTPVYMRLKSKCLK